MTGSWYSVLMLGSVLAVLGSLMGTSSGLAQLPQLPPAPPAPPADPPVTPPASPSSPPNADPSPTDTSSPTFIRPQVTCPEDFTTLSSLLIRDIPGYTNRVLQSRVADIKTEYRPAYVITASLPERTPLEIRDRVYTTDLEASESLEQLFFTTLERQYSDLEATSIEHFHWLFLAPNDEGWEMVFMFSTIAPDGEEALLPPRDSSQGSVGQAVQQWLRDCEAEAISPAQN